MEWYRQAAEAGHARAALHVGAYLTIQDPDDPEVLRWFALWTQHEDSSSMSYAARRIDPEEMSVSINLTRREPGGDALYTVTTPAIAYRF